MKVRGATRHRHHRDLGHFRCGPRPLRPEGDRSYLEGVKQKRTEPDHPERM